MATVAALLSYIAVRMVGADHIRHMWELDKACLAFVVSHVCSPECTGRAVFYIGRVVKDLTHKQMLGLAIFFPFFFPFTP
jgi:hypothetical protein